jgi:hypothetical protein
MRRNSAQICLLILTLLMAGCAGPLAGLGGSDTDDVIESAAADESFPDAAEAGITSGSL